MRENGRSRFALQLGAIALVGLVLRLVYVQLHSRHGALGFDANTYYELAKRLVARRAYVSPFDRGGHEQPTALFPPGFPMLLAGFRIVALTTRTKALFGMAFVGTATVVLVGVVGRRLGGARVGLIAAALAAVYPNLWLADGALMTESLTAALVVTMIWLLLRAQDETTNVRWLLVGIPAAAAALTRSDAWLFVLVIVLAGSLTCRDVPLRRRTVCAALALAMPFAVVLAWEVRTAARMHAFVPVAVNSWDVIAGANCREVYFGDQIGSWVTTCLKYGNKHDEIAANQHARDRGITYARGHTRQLPFVIVARLGRTFGFYDTWSELDAEAFYEGRSLRWSQVGFAMYLLLVPLAVVGALQLRRRRQNPALVILCVPIATVLFSTIAGYGNHRFRIPLEPTLVWLAAIAVALPWAPRSHGAHVDRRDVSRVPSGDD